MRVELTQPGSALELLVNWQLDQRYESPTFAHEIIFLLAFYKVIWLSLLAMCFVKNYHKSNSFHYLNLDLLFRNNPLVLSLLLLLFTAFTLWPTNKLVCEHQNDNDNASADMTFDCVITSNNEKNSSSTCHLLVAIRVGLRHFSDTLATSFFQRIKHLTLY